MDMKNLEKAVRSISKRNDPKPYREGIRDGEDEVMQQTFTFGYYDGNSGVEMTFDSYEEAEKEAEYKWDRLTPKEKIKYTDPDTGAYFAIFEGGNSIDDCIIVRDFAEE